MTQEPEGQGWNPKVPPKLWDSVRITTRTSLRGVNGSLTEKLVQRPNKTFENADIRGIGMGRDVIVAGVVE